MRIPCHLTRKNWQPCLTALEPPFNGGAIVKAHVSRAAAMVGTSNRVQVLRTARDADLASASLVRAKCD